MGIDITLFSYEMYLFTTDLGFMVYLCLLHKTNQAEKCK